MGFLESEDRHLIISKKKKDNHRCGSIPEEGKMDRLMPGSSRLEGPGSSKLEEAKKKKKKKQPFSRSYRFQLKLDLPDDGKAHYPDFNWLDLVAQEEETKVAAKRKEVLDPFASDDEDQIAALARQFEDKYGGASEKIRQKKKARKLDDYADLGFGYDSDDPFIDNTDVHDEIVPQNLTTVHGGFYVNCGPLEFKARESADEDSDVETVLAGGAPPAVGEIPTKKRKPYKKATTAHIAEPPPKKKAKESSQNSKPTPPPPSTASTLAPKPPTVSVLPNDVEAKKPRARKEGSKPLGRPKKLNPDGTLVHPPKFKKVKQGLSVPSSTSSSEKPKSSPSAVAAAVTITAAKNIPNPKQVATAPAPTTSAGATITAVTSAPSSSKEGTIRQHQLSDQQREELLQKQLMEQVLEMQRRQEEYMKQEKQKQLVENAASDADKRKKQQLLQQQKQMKAQQEQQKRIQREQEQKRLQQQQQREQEQKKAATTAKRARAENFAATTAAAKRAGTEATPKAKRAG